MERNGMEERGYQSGSRGISNNHCQKDRMKGYLPGGVNSSGRLTRYSTEHRLNNRHPHNNKPKSNARIGRDLLSTTGTTKLDVAQRREDVRQSRSAGGSNELKNHPEVARYKGQCHRAEDQRSGENQMSIGIERFIGEIVCCHNRSADEGLQR